MKLLLAFVFMLALNTKVYGCSCLAYDIEQAFEEYELVFVGEVAALGKHKLSDSSFFSPFKIKKAKLRISKVYKGSVSNSIEIITHNDSAACGYAFKKGEEYAVFAYFDKDEGKYMVSSCSPTIHAKAGEQRLEEERNKVMGFLEKKGNT